MWIANAARSRENTQMPQVSWSSAQLAEISVRVRIARAAFASSQVEMAHRVGISTQGWSHYEKGRSAPTNPVLAKLKSLHGITRDWIMDGSWVGVPPETAERLRTTPDPGTRPNARPAKTA